MIKNLERFIGRPIVKISEEFADFELLRKMAKATPSARFVNTDEGNWLLARPLRKSDLSDEAFATYVAKMYKNDTEINHFLKLATKEYT